MTARRRLGWFSHKLLLKVASVSTGWAQRLHASPLKKSLQQWRVAGGDHKLRLDYPLTPASLVLDVGGYQGQWSSDIFARYQCPIHIFEPVVEFAQAIEQRFRHNPAIRVHRYGLAECTGTVELGLSDNASSIFAVSRPKRTIQLVRASDWLAEQTISQVALMKINIEGGEYALLEDLLATGWVSRIDNLQVQFHPFVSQAQLKMEQIQNQLRRTHHLTYQYPFIWENWERN